jgi:hypothetical protein
MKPVLGQKMFWPKQPKFELGQMRAKLALMCRESESNLL